MSGTGQVLGSSTATTGVGVAILPNTGGNILLSIFGIALVVVGLIVMASFVGTRVYSRIAR